MPQNPQTCLATSPLSLSSQHSRVLAASLLILLEAQCSSSYLRIRASWPSALLVFFPPPSARTPIVDICLTCFVLRLHQTSPMSLPGPPFEWQSPRPLSVVSTLLLVLFSSVAHVTLRNAGECTGLVIFCYWNVSSIMILILICDFQ